MVWIELTSAVNNPDPSKLAEEFLEFVQEPEICKAVSFAEGTYNPVTQMGDPEMFELYDAEELDAIQWDSLAEEMARSLDYQVVVPTTELIEIYNAPHAACVTASSGLTAPGRALSCLAT